MAKGFMVNNSKPPINKTPAVTAAPVVQQVKSVRPGVAGGERRSGIAGALGAETPEYTVGDPFAGSYLNYLNPESSQGSFTDILRDDLNRGEASGWDYLSAFSGLIDAPFFDNINKTIEGVQLANQKGDWKQFFTPFEENKFADSFGAGVQKSLERGKGAYNPFSPNFFLTQGLAEVDKRSKGADRLLDKTGWKEQEYDPNTHWYNSNPFVRRKGQLDVGDITEALMAPSNAITFGSASVSKLAAKAYKDALKRVAEGEGISLAKGANVDDLVDAVYRSQVAKASRVLNQPGLNQQQMKVMQQGVEQQARETANKARKFVNDKVKEAKVKAQDTLISADLLGTPFAQSLVMKPKWMRKQAQEIGEAGGRSVAELLVKVGIVDDQIMREMLDNIYGVSDPAKLTQDMYEDLIERIKTAKDDAIPKLGRDAAQVVNEYNHYANIVNQINKGKGVKPIPLAQSANVIYRLLDKAGSESAFVSRMRKRISKLRSQAVAVRGVNDYTDSVYAQAVGKGLDDVSAQLLDEWEHYTRKLNPNAPIDLEDKIGKLKHSPTGLQQLQSSLATLRTQFENQFARPDPVTKVVQVPDIEKWVPKNINRKLPEDQFFDPEGAIARQAERDRLSRIGETPVEISDRFKDYGKYQRDVHRTDMTPTYKKLLETNFGRVVRLGRAFNSSTLGIKETFIDLAADLVRRTKIKKSGLLKKYERQIRDLENMSQNMSDDALSAVAYQVENAYPEAWIKDGRMSQFSKDAQVLEMSNKITKLLTELGAEGKATGMINALRRDYFPHIRPLSPEKIAEMANRAEALGYREALEKLSGVSLTTTFSKQRKVFLKLAELDDEIAKLQLDRADALALGDTATADNIAGRLSLLEDMFIRDPAKAMGSYIYQFIKSKSMKELYDEFLERGLIRYDKLTDDFVPLTVGDVRAMGLKSKMVNLDLVPEGAKMSDEVEIYMHPQLLDSFRKVGQIFAKPQTLANNVVRHYDAFMTIWKQLTLNVFPKTAVLNLIGNVFNCMLAGMPPTAMRGSVKLLNKYRKNPQSLTPGEQKLFQEAYENGILGQGSTADYILDTPEDAMIGLEKLSAKLNDVPWLGTMRTAQDVIDDVTRFALFKSAKDAGRSTKDAADVVRQYLFNYTEVTTADQVVRRFLPFWSWMKNNIPLQVVNLIRQPRFYALAEQMRQSTFGDDKEQYPEYVQQSYTNTPLGPLALNLPSSDIPNLISDNPFKTIVGSMAPPLRLAAELAFNEKLRSGAPITRATPTGEASEMSDANFWLYSLTQLGGTVAQTGYDVAKETGGLRALAEAGVPGFEANIKDKPRPGEEVFSDLATKAMVAAPYKPPIDPYYGYGLSDQGQVVKDKGVLEKLGDLFGGGGQ